jgi:hypothetical protein
MAEEMINTSNASLVTDWNIPTSVVSGKASFSNPAPSVDAQGNVTAVKTLVNIDEYSIPYNVQLRAKAGSKPTAQQFILNKVFTLCTAVGIGSGFTALGSTTFGKLADYLVKSLPKAAGFAVFVPPVPGGKYGEVSFFATEAEANAAADKARASRPTSAVSADDIDLE